MVKNKIIFSDENVELTKEEAAYFKEKLEKMLEEINNDSDKTVSKIRKTTSKDSKDLADFANLSSEDNITLRIGERKRKLIEKIRLALSRIELNTYNVCQECEEIIGKNRLDARPVTTLCIRCKEIQEQEERARQ